MKLDDKINISIGKDYLDKNPENNIPNKPDNKGNTKSFLELHG